MRNQKKLERAAAEAAAAQAAAEAAARKARELSRSAAAEQAAYLFGEAQKRASGLLGQAQQRAGELYGQASSVIIPLAKDAKVRTAGFAAKRLEAWEPHIKDALNKVGPVVEAAREKVTDSLLPQAQTLLRNAAEHPAVVEAGRRAEASVQALKGEFPPKVEVVVPPKKSKLKSFGKFLAIGAVVAGAVAAVRHFLTPKDDGWTAHEPSKAYVHNNDTFATAAKFADSAPTTATQPAADATAAEPKDDQANQEVSSEQPARAAEATANNYGEGSYVGLNPPEGFEIKGNERSMKYHLKGSGGYERTIAEVWFASEEAAEAAGFTRALR